SRRSAAPTAASRARTQWSTKRCEAQLRAWVTLRPSPPRGRRWDNDRMLTRAQVSTFVGRTVYARGEQVLEAERVVSVARNGAKVVGHVLGTRDENYVVTITMSSASPDARPTLGRCTCPVRLVCKHCAA